MPEGDSVYRLARRLRPALVGRRLVRAELRVPAFATLDLAGATVAGIDARGQHQLTRLVWADDSPHPPLTLHTHLKMTGSWTVVGAGKRLPARLMDTVRVLLDHGGDPELPNDRGQMPLAAAAFKGDMGVVRLLLERGGLMLTIAATVVVAAFADRDHRPLGVLGTVVFLMVLCWWIFIRELDIRVPLWPQI